MQEDSQVRKLVRTLVFPAVVGLAIAAGVGIGSQAQAQQPAQPNIPRVIIIDNNGVFQPAGDAEHRPVGLRAGPPHRGEEAPPSSSTIRRAISAPFGDVADLDRQPVHHCL
ncbi:MAG: hypothetical protein U0531_17385 [Dehalococcoidia bacterium]